MKYLFYAVFIILALLLTFFGIGPVLFADGSFRERMITLGIVCLCYILLVTAFVFIKKRWMDHR